MIYYAATHTEGADVLEHKYDLPSCTSQQYVHQSELFKYFDQCDMERLFDAVAEHPTVHAYVLDDLEMYFHPQSLTGVISKAYQEFFSQII